MYDKEAGKLIRLLGSILPALYTISAIAIIFTEGVIFHMSKSDVFVIINTILILGCLFSGIAGLITGIARKKGRL